MLHKDRQAPRFVYPPLELPRFRVQFTCPKASMAEAPSNPPLPNFVSPAQARVMTRALRPGVAGSVIANISGEDGS